jgi:hypothetical protein
MCASVCVQQVAVSAGGRLELNSKDTLADTTVSWCHTGTKASTI